jgi:2-(1,2-epoxy-1,2-dihydrophenyl)acetyl-CoA isomerase
MADVEVLMRDGITTICLNRPARKNATTPELWTLVETAVMNAADSQDVRCVVITGAGDTFCSGADTGASFPRNAGESRSRMAKAHGVITRIYNLGKPVITSVRGAAYGSGLSLALCGDFLITSNTAKLCYAFTRLGLVGDCGALYFLSERLGSQLGKFYAYTGEVISGADAAARGLALKCVADDELEAETAALAARLAQGPTLAISVSKRMMQRRYSVLEDFLSTEFLAIPLIATTADAAEGLQAAREKRRARFLGA